MLTIIRILQTTLDLLFPPQCIRCHTHGSILCSTCLAAIKWITTPICQRCGIPLLYPAGHCQHCSYSPLPLHGIRTLGLYQEPLRTYIHDLKYQGQQRLSEPLGLLLAKAYQAYRLNVDIIMPVPLHKTRQRERGYNQSQLLAEVCAYHLKIPLNIHVLTRIRNTSAQAHLTPHERQSNVANAFRCHAQYMTGALYGFRVLVIDDVCTTGSTLSACATTLFAAGAREVWGLVLARPVS